MLVPSSHHCSFERMCTMFLHLAYHRIPDAAMKQELDQLIKGIADAEQQRNQLIHSAWLVNDAGMVTRLKIAMQRKRGLRAHHEGISPSDIDAAADRFSAL